jgi:hypothetical protein
MRRKLLSILALLLIAAGSAWAERVNVTFSANGKSIVKENVELQHTYWCDYSLRNGELDEIIWNLYGFEDGRCWVVWVASSASGSNITAGKGDILNEITAPDDYHDMYITLAEGFRGQATVTCQYDKVIKNWDDALGDWSEDYEQYDITLTITATPIIDVTSVSLPASATLDVGQTTTLAATISPSNATNKTVTWSSSNTSVATVSNSGVMTAVATGSATITATATNGTADPSDDMTATCIVTVATPINAVSEDGTIGTFTDANGQTRLGIVVTLNGNKYAISMNEETDLSGLSGTNTKKVGSHTYYNQADACQKFANNKADGTYNVANVWRLPTTTEMSYLVALGGSAWDGTAGHADMTEYTGTNLVANAPYLYKANATGEVDFGGTYEIPNPLAAGSTESNGWTFKGTFDTIEWTEAPTGIYGFSAQNVDEQGISQGQFVKVGSYVRIKPMRCYLKNESFAGARGMNRAAADEPLPETIKVRLISASGDVMGIGSLQKKTGEVTIDNEAWYSLDGRRIVGQPNAKGIYVNNGKKVIIK